MGNFLFVWSIFFCLTYLLVLSQKKKSLKQKCLSIFWITFGPLLTKIAAWHGLSQMVKFPFYIILVMKILTWKKLFYFWIPQLKPMDLVLGDGIFRLWCRCPILNIGFIIILRELNLLLKNYCVYFSFLNL